MVNGDLRFYSTLLQKLILLQQLLDLGLQMVPLFRKYLVRMLLDVALKVLKRLHLSN